MVESKNNALQLAKSSRLTVSEQQLFSLTGYWAESYKAFVATLSSIPIKC
jgi:hypothetical protein